MKRERFLLLTIATFGAMLPVYAGKATPPSGQQIFKQHCASCHANGGNLVHREKPLAGSAELTSIIRFKKYLSHPPGHMPYYQNLVGNDKMIKSLYDYCKTFKKAPRSS
ncbi:MAG: c-type cytochrome [Candidatus Obscuribacterales bacterium]|nr:c-type cytochrome [Candidatus Obscuribacterales bacterium]